MLVGPPGNCPAYPCIKMAQNYRSIYQELQKLWRRNYDKNKLDSEKVEVA
jgi:hypothetical protein